MDWIVWKLYLNKAAFLKKQDWEYNSVLERLPSMQETLGSIPSTTRTKTKQNKKG
jgi:hypothetical protein